MRDILAKLSIIPLTFDREAWRWWLDDVWRIDLDMQECCDGRECGCYGSTFRQRHAHYNYAFRWISK